MTNRMPARQATRWAVLLTVLLSAVAIPVSGQSMERASTSETFVVDNDGDAQYRSIQAAVNDTSDGDVVRVRPGTYREVVVIETNITLVAPDGATLNGTTAGESAAGIRIPRGISVAPEILGFTVVGYTYGIDADDTTGDWTVSNTTIRGGPRSGYQIGVSATETTGEWALQNVTIHNTSGGGVYAMDARGAWCINDSVITNVEDGVVAQDTRGDWWIRNSTIQETVRGIDVTAATGNWTVAQSTVRRAGLIAINAQNASGSWRLVGTTVRTNTVGVNALRASGDWTIRGSRVVNSTKSKAYDFIRPPLPEGVGIYAAETRGAWTVHETTLQNHTDAAIVAKGAVPAGEATRNQWGNLSPGEACVGNVTCTRQTVTTSTESQANASATTTLETPGNPTRPSQNASSKTGAVAVLGAAVLGIVVLVRWTRL